MAIALRTSVRALFELRFELRYLRIESQEGAIPFRKLRDRSAIKGRAIVPESSS